MLPVRGVERAVAKTVIGAFKGNHARLARRQHRRLERRLDRLKAGVAEDRLPCRPQRRCRATSAFGLRTSDFPATART